MSCILFFFFFSSRRRHTRWTGDWSSDVCSSDLVAVAMRVPQLVGGAGRLVPDDDVPVTGAVRAALDQSVGRDPVRAAVALARVLEADAHGGRRAGHHG